MGKQQQNSAENRKSSFCSAVNRNENTYRSLSGWYIVVTRKAEVVTVVILLTFIGECVCDLKTHTNWDKLTHQQSSRVTLNFIKAARMRVV